ncbi:hypothetical protein J4727_15240 [Providencia rettgeri]|uniref:Uncharacterized protein n=1 Tax=Providencia rettgeri TaxID=587 RepID=A0A939NF12_PRORE|nr:hypothetical protein [Providencia rettgeri]
MTINGVKIQGEANKDYSNSWKVGGSSGTTSRNCFFATAIEPGTSWALPTNQIAGLQPDTLEGQVLLTSRPPLDVSRYIRELFAYPYGCLEQTISGLYPSLFSTQAELNKIGIKTQTDADRHKAIEVFRIC